MKQFFICLFITICTNLNVFAQTKLSVSYKDTVSISEPVTIKYIVEDDKEFEITPKPLNLKNGFMELLTGPYTSTNTSLKMYNGKLTTRKSISFTYTFLCSKPGIYYVPSLTVTDSVGNEKYFTDDMSFYVSNDAKYRKKKDTTADINMVDTTVNTAKSKILEIEAVVDRNKISLGDSVKCQIYFFTNLDVVSINTLKDLEVDNAIRHEIPTDAQKTFKETIYKGMPVKTVLWAEYYLTPLQSGKIKIKDGSFKANYLENDPNIDIFEAFFSGKIGKERDSIINRNYDLTIFAKHPYKISKDELEEYKDSIKNSNNDGSAVYDAVLSTITNRETGEIDKESILLLTDGSDNCSRISANTLTNILLENGIRVDVVAFASKTDSIYYAFKDSIDTNGDDIYDDVVLKNTLVENNQNLDKIKEIAAATGGVFVQVCNEAQLPEAILQIQNAISTDEKSLKKPVKMFNPDKNMLNKLYKEICDVSKIPL